MCVGFLSVFLWAVALGFPASAEPLFKLEAPMGPHAVGLRVVEQYDYSRVFQPPIDDLGRPYSGERARPIQTLIWYPARKSQARPMTFGAYLKLGDTEASFGRPRAIHGPANYFLSGMAGSLDEPMAAVRDAAPVQGRFPVIIYAASFSANAFENADLCEYLASFGYVVIASPGMGVGHDSTHDPLGVEAQARDISFLVGYAHSQPDADPSHLAVVGFSWGGLSNLFSAARDDRIKALVDLDGSIRYWPGLVKAGGIDPSRIAIPLLFFKSQDTIEDQDHLEHGFPTAAGPSVLNQWSAGDLISIQMLRMVHPEFSSYAYRNRNFWKVEFSHLRFGDFDREDGVVGYSWMARYTKAFLDHYLKGDPEGLQFLKARPAEVGVPPHVLQVKFQPGAGRPFGETDFRVQVARKGFEHISDVYAESQKGHPKFALSPADLLSWGMNLTADGNGAEAVWVVKLAIQMDPSSGSYVALGAAYLGAGRTRDAIAAYQEALTKDPGNLLAQSALEQIGHGQAP